MTTEELMVNTPQKVYMTAQEAKEATLNSSVMIEKQFEEIMEAIEYAANAGRSFIEWKCAIARPNVKKLKELGYEAQAWVISWEG